MEVYDLYHQLLVGTLSIVGSIDLAVGSFPQFLILRNEIRSSF